MITYRAKNTRVAVEYIDPETRQIARADITLPGHRKDRYKKELMKQLAKQGFKHVPYFDVVEIECTTTTYQMSEEEFIKRAHLQSIKNENKTEYSAAAQ